MNQTGQSAFNQARIEWAIRLRFSPMPRLDPEVMSSQLNAFRIGELRVVGKTWECQMERDGELAVNAVKRASDLAVLPYQVVSDGSEDGDKHAAALTYFYKHARVTKALDQDSIGGISDLLRQMASAHSYYYSAHEMLLRVDNPDAKEVTAEFRHTPVWFFESRRGYLAYLKHIFDVYGQPCVQGEWLTCVGEGWMRPLSIAFCMKAFSLRDWNIWCARYASGFLEGIVDEAPGTTGWEEAKSALQTMANDGAVVHSPKVILKFLEQAARSGMPFKELVDLVNSLYAKCYRGVDLATGSKSGGSSAGAGGGSSNVVGASVQSEESGIYLASDALWATGYLNDRVDRPIIRYLFNQEPRAAIAVTPPPDDTTDEDLKVVQALVPLGWKIALKDVYKRFRWEAPADSEPCLQAPVPLGPPKPGDGGSTLGAPGAAPASPITPKPETTPSPAAPKTADETEETTRAAQEDETTPIGAGADPASLGKPQTFAPEMPDPQVDAAAFWSGAGAALRSIFGPFVRKPMDRMTDGTLPALATAIPNDGGPPKVSEKLEQASRERLAGATHEDMAHAAAKVKALLQITDPGHFAARAREVLGEWDSVTANTLMVPKAADALDQITATAFADGIQQTKNPAEAGSKKGAA